MFIYVLTRSFNFNTLVCKNKLTAANETDLVF